MGYDIGPKIGIDGEAEFRKSIGSINTTLKTLGTEMKVVTSRFDDNADSQFKAAAKTDTLNKQVDAQKQKLKLLEDGLRESAKQYGENDEKTQRWQQVVNKATAELNDMEKEVRQNSNQLNDFGKEEVDTKEKTDDLEKKVKSAGKAASVSGDAFRGMGDKLKTAAIAIGAATAATALVAAKMATSVVKSFAELEQNLGGSEAVFGEYAKTIQAEGEEAYKNLGLSQSAYLATANKMGALFQGSGMTQQQSLDMTTKAMQRAADMASVMGIEQDAAMEAITGAAKGNYTMMDNLGVKMNDTSIKAYALANGFKGTWAEASNTEKAQYAMEMFFDTTGQYAGNFEKEASSTISGSLGTLKASVESFVAGLGNSDADIKNLTQNIIDAFGDVAANVTPILENVIKALPQAIDALLPEINKILPNLIATFTSIATSTINALTESLPTLLPSIISALSSIATVLIENAPIFINAFFQIATSVLTGLVEQLPALTSSITTLLQSLTTLITEMLPILIPLALSMLQTIGQGLLDNLPLLIESAFSIIEQLGTSLAESLPELIPSIVDIMLKIVDTLIENIDMLVDLALLLIQSLADGLIKALPKLVEKAPVLIEKLIKAITDNLPKIIEMGIKLIIQLSVGLIEAIPELIKAIPEIIGALLEGLLGMGPDLLEAGKGIIKEIKNGIKKIDPLQWGKDIIDSLVQGIKNGIKKVKEAVASVADAVKNFLGFSEPEEGPLSNFHTYMPDMIDLMTKGIIGNKNKVTSALKGLAADMSGAIPTDISTTVSANTKYGAKGFNAGKAAGISIVIENFNNNTQEDISILAEKLAFETQRRLRGNGYVYA